MHIWRRSYAVPPPPLEPGDPRHPRNDPRYSLLDPLVGRYCYLEPVCCLLQVALVYSAVMASIPGAFVCRQLGSPDAAACHGPTLTSLPRLPAGLQVLPGVESLATCLARVLPYWHDAIAPAIRGGQRVLVAAHGNSLRALVKYLDNVPDQDITALEIPVGVPLVYELGHDLR